MEQEPLLVSSLSPTRYPFLGPFPRGNSNQMHFTVSHFLLEFYPSCIVELWPSCQEPAEGAKFSPIPMLFPTGVIL
jgi:hypothetical protein